MSMPRALSRVGWMLLGIAVASVALAWPVRWQRAVEGSSEVAVDGSQAVIRIQSFHLGYQTSPGGVAAAVLMEVLSPFAAIRSTHRIDQGVVLVIDARGVRTMRFPGVGGPLYVTADGPVMRVGDQGFRWTGAALVSLTPDEYDAVVRDGASNPRPPWSTRGFVFRDPAIVLPLTIGAAPYRLEARAAGDVKTLSLVDPRGGRQVIWSLDQSWQSVTAEEFRTRFRH